MLCNCSKDLLLAPVKMWKPMSRMLLSRSMTAVPSYASRDQFGKSFAAISQMSLASGCFIHHCHRIYEVSYVSSEQRIVLTPRQETHEDLYDESSAPAEDGKAPWERENGETDIFAK